MKINVPLFVIQISIISRISAQICPDYTAGSTNTDGSSSNTVSAIYVNNRNSEAAECSGTVYAWHYCYYDENSESNLEVAFGAFSFGSDRVYSLRDGSYYLLHLDTRETAFTCDTITLDPTQHFQIQAGDRVGACLRHNGDIDYLDILRDTLLFRYVDVWSQSDGGCTQADMAISPPLSSAFFEDNRSNFLHLYVDINIDECAVGEDNCHEHAICSDTVGGQGSFQCSCNAGYTGTGDNCINIDECSFNMDNCSSIATCMDIEGSFICTCATGYTGDGVTCTPLGINECSSDTHDCSVNATCTDNDDSFICTCNTGYTGDGNICNSISGCETISCDMNAECTATTGGYFCSCLSGYSGNGMTCADLNECEDGADSCDVNAECTNTDGSYTCSCTSGYSGDGFMCNDIDECTVGVCSDNAVCTNSDGSFVCRCLLGFSGDGLVCSDINECDGGANSCDVNARCTNTDGSYTCSCVPGYTGEGLMCSDIDECRGGTNNCAEEASCINIVGSYGCTCITGYSGNGIDCNDNNECESGTDSCAVNAECTNTDGGYMCSCISGYSGDGITCNDINECLEAENESVTCHSNAHCNNTPGSFICDCMMGYEGDGIDCRDVDECETPEQCGTGGECKNSMGSYSCVCSIGYHLQNNLCIDLNECEESHGTVCGKNSMCVNSEGSYTCRCLDGFMGHNCTDINECEGGIDSCDMNAECTNTDGSYTCSCTFGYSGDGLMCLDINECTDGIESCAETATCSNTLGSFICACLPGYSGNGISCTDIDECQSRNITCGINAECSNTDGSFVCTCLLGYSGDGTKCTDVDECSVLFTEVCSGAEACENTEGSYTCLCTAGYTWNGTLCIDLDECLVGVPDDCSEVAHCVNTVGSHMCQCKYGYEGDGYNCSDINECSDETHGCDSNAECINTNGDYKCHCIIGYTGNGIICEALPDVASPEQQSGGGSGSLGAGVIVGIAVGTLVIITLLLGVGVFCAMKIRLRSRSKSVAVAFDSIGFENQVYGAVDGGNIQMGTIKKDKTYSSSGIYDTPHDLKATNMGDIQDSNCYEYATMPVGVSKHPTLECYSAVDYYSTMNEYVCTEEDYDDILRQARTGGSVVCSKDADLYYFPAEREDELYQQLQKQRIKAIPMSHITQLGKLGSGEFGTVCKGQWTCSEKVLDVAIKVLSDPSDESQKVKFLQEAAIMSQFRHPNVIKLYGVVSDADQIMLVVELLEKGDLRQALARMKPDPGQLHASDLPMTLLAFSRQTALGMVYLSGKGFVHRDIAARNILLSHNNICKICDFGMSRDLEEDNYYVSRGGKVPVKWTAPEAIAYKKYSTASDVWSYGCLLYEMWSLGHKPFEENTNQEVVKMVVSGYRLPPPPGCPKAIYQLMIDCWNPTPSARPTFHQVLLSLLGDDKDLLGVPQEDKATHNLAGTLGSPLEAGYSMYLRQQYCYKTDSSAQMTAM